VEFEKVFIALAEIGVAIAGFSGVVAVFGARSEGQWTPDDRLRLAFLLACSMTVVFFSLLPFPMTALHVPATVVWRVASGLLAVWLILADILAFRSVARARHRFQLETRPWLKWLVRIGDAAAVSVLLDNVIWMAEAGLLLFALLWLLLQSVIMFTELLGFSVGHAGK
jgi:hypothetical protein